VFIDVPSGGHLEDGAQAGDLGGRHVLGQDVERLLLQLVHGREALHAAQDDVVQRRAAGCPMLLHPLVLQDLVGGRPLPGVLQRAEASACHSHERRTKGRGCYADK
jgi:hypothetical protein